MICSAPWKYEVWGWSWLLIFSSCDMQDAAKYRDQLKEIAPHSLLKCSSDCTTLVWILLTFTNSYFVVTFLGIISSGIAFNLTASVQWLVQCQVPSWKSMEYLVFKCVWSFLFRILSSEIISNPIPKHLKIYIFFSINYKRKEIMSSFFIWASHNCKIRNELSELILNLFREFEYKLRVYI